MYSTSWANDGKHVEFAAKFYEIIEAVFDRRELSVFTDGLLTYPFSTATSKAVLSNVRLASPPATT